MRVTKSFKHLLQLPGIHVGSVEFLSDKVVVTVALRRRALECPHCEHRTSVAYEANRPVVSRWRHLDLGVWRLEINAHLRRLRCPDHGVRVEGVPFAGPGSRFTADFESLVAWLATKTDKTTITEQVRIDWKTVGRICARVVAERLDPQRLADLFEIGVDEISWKKHHHYLTLVTNHRTRKIVWAARGKDTATLNGFFTELGADRTAAITAVSMDMGTAFRKSVREQAPEAVICFDPFHVIQAATDALEVVRREEWQQPRRLPDQHLARKFKGARWALLKNPEDLTDDQALTLAGIRHAGGAAWRGYQLKEALRSCFSRELTAQQTIELLDRWCSRAQRSRPRPFIKAAATIRNHRDGILAAINLGLSNGLIEGLNNKVRLIIRRAYGFHSADAAIALVMLSCEPIELTLPRQKAA